MSRTPNGIPPASDERREKRDRRNNDRRLDERRKSGIGEIIDDRRQGPRRDTERRDERGRRYRREK